MRSDERAELDRPLATFLVGGFDVPVRRFFPIFHIRRYTCKVHVHMFTIVALDAWRFSLTRNFSIVKV